MRAWAAWSSRLIRLRIFATNANFNKTQSQPLDTPEPSRRHDGEHTPDPCELCSRSQLHRQVHTRQLATATHTSTTSPCAPHLYQITNDFRCFLKFHYWPLERENASAILYHAVQGDRSGIRAKARPELFSGFFCVPATAWTLLPPTSTHLCSLFTHLPSYITCKPLWPAPLPYAPEPTHARSYRPTKCV